ncbi:MAG: archaellin/type IV pilin N-terminal domain-containing protein [Thermoplasmatota archaeon]
MKANQSILKNKLDDEAVSPVIAVILMVAITVVLAATVYVWVSGFGAQGNQAKSLSVSEVACATGGGASAVKFTVVSVSPNFLYSGTNGLIIKDASVPAATFPIGTPAAGATIAAGDTMSITPTGAYTCSDILNFVDQSGNTVVATITLHPA